MSVADLLCVRHCTSCFSNVISVMEETLQGKGFYSLLIGKAEIQKLHVFLLIGPCSWDLFWDLPTQKPMS